MLKLKTVAKYLKKIRVRASNRLFLVATLLIITIIPACGEYTDSGSEIVLIDTVPEETVITVEDDLNLQSIAHLTEHQADVIQVVFSPDGAYMATGGHDNRVLYRDARDGSVLHEFIFQFSGRGWGQIRSLAFNQDGRWLAAGGFNSTINIWDSSTHSLVAVLGDYSERSHVARMEFDPITDYLAVSYDDGIVIVWDVINQTQVYTIHDDFTSRVEIAFSPDGQYLYLAGITINASGEMKRVIEIRETDTREITLQVEEVITSIFHDMEYGGIALSSDGEQLFVNNYDRTLLIFDASDLSLLQIMVSATPTYGLPTLVTDRSGHYVAFADETYGLRVWDLQSNSSEGEPTIFDFEDRFTNILSIDLSPDGETLVFGTSEGGLHFFDTATMTERFVVYGHTAGVIRVEFSPDGEYFVSSAADRRLLLWDFARQEVIAEIEHDDNVFPASQLLFTPDNRYLIFDTFNYIMVWDIENNQELGRYHSGDIRSMALSPDGQMLALGGPAHKIRLVDIATITEVAQWEPDQPGFVKSVDFSPDGRTLAVGTDTSFFLWDWQSQEILYRDEEIRPVDNVIYSPQGDLIAITGQGSLLNTILLWDVDSQEIVRWLDNPIGFGSYVEFSPDSRYFAAGIQGEKLIRVWDVASGEVIANLRGHYARVYTFSFSPDGNYIVSGSSDGIRLWELP